nr:hypothetical protein [Tanacetum cinerariifolium]
MAHQQLVADVHPDELCPPNKRYDPMDANKKIDLEHVQCPPESKILINIIKNHPLRFSIAASSSVPCIYMAQFWHTLKEDKLLWEGIHYSLLHLISLIPYPRFTKIIISHYMTNFLEISRRIRDKYHNQKDDDLMKNIFNSRRYKDKVGMKIPDWMISERMKQTEHYRMYTEVFGIDVPLIQSPPTESTQGAHGTPSAPRSPTLKVDAVESSVPKQSTVIRLRLPQRKSIRLTPPALVLTVDKADDLILQDTLQVSLSEYKSRQEQEARENMALVKKHLASAKIEKMVEGQEHVVDDSSILRNDEHNIPGTREKGKWVEESRITPFPTPIRSPRINTDLVSLDTKKFQELTVPHTTPSSSLPSNKLSHTNQLLSLFKAKPARFKRYKSFFQELQGRYGYLFEHLRAKFMPRKSFVTLADHLQEAMAESLPTMVDKHIKEKVEKQVPEQVRNQVLVYVAERTPAIRPRDQDDPHDNAHPEGENSAKRQNTSNNEAYVSGESSPGHDNEQEQGPSASRPEKIVLSLHKFPVVVFNDDDIKEQTSRWVNKCVKKFNPYARYGVEHWRNPHAKIFYIRKQKNLKTKGSDLFEFKDHLSYQDILDYADAGLLWSLSVFIRSSVIWERVHDFQLGFESYQQKFDLTALTISFLEVEKHSMFSIIYEPVHEIIYKNSKKEKRVMRHSEIHKFCDATLNRVLEGLKSYNNDVRYGYNQRDLTKDEVEYLKLFEEEIDDRLKLEKVNDLGANGDMSGSRVRVVWIEVGGGIARARVVSRVVLGLVMKVVLMVLRGWEVLVR